MVPELHKGLSKRMKKASMASSSTALCFSAPLFFDWKPGALVERAVDLCNDDDACRKRFPDLFWDFQQLPFDMRKVTLDGDAIPPELLPHMYQKRLRALLSRHRLAELPADITKTAMSLAIALAEDTAWTPPPSLSQSMRGIGLLMHFAILCAEEIRPFDDRELDNFGQPFSLSFYRKACAKLEANANHQVKLDKAWRKAQATSRPVLIFNGAYDTSVNPEFSEPIEQLYPNSRHVQVPLAGHDIVSKITCAREILADFLNGKAPRDLVDGCARLNRVKFIAP